MANAITVGRTILLFIVLWIMYGSNPVVVQWCAPAIAVVVLLDSLDGYVARKRHETSQFGAIIDIVGDRIVEVACWIVFAHMGLLPVWIPLLVITRAFLVDGLRASSYSEGMTAFGEKTMMRSKLTTWLTASRAMRGTFGGSKVLAFVFLAVMRAHSLPGGPATLIGQVGDFSWFRICGWIVIWVAVAMTVIRGIPVVVDGVAYLRAKDAA